MCELLGLVAGWHAEAAYGLTEAVSCAVLHPPDAVILDLEMPGTNGFHTADRLRAVLAGRHTLFVAVTGNAELQVVAAHDVRFSKSMMKPADTTWLLRMLAEMGTSH